MSAAETFLQLPLDLLTDFGTTCTYVQPNATGAASGVVTETETETEDVDCFGPIGETKDSEASGARARFVIPASGFVITPRVGDRLLLPGAEVGDSPQTWLVVAVDRVSVANIVVAWRLSCAEQPEAE